MMDAVYNGKVDQGLWNQGFGVKVSADNRDEFIYFLPHPLQGKSGHPRVSFFHALHKGFVCHEVKLPQEPAGPEKAERIFLKALRSLSHGPEFLMFQIVKTMEIIIQISPAVQGHGIHREVPTGYIFFQGI